MDKFMQIAVDEATATLKSGGQPYGATLVRGDEILASGQNRVIQNNDPTSHAEMEAIRAAGRQPDYADTVMYASAFPCLMCAGAIVRLGIPKVIVGASWSGCEDSQAFLAANNVAVEILELPVCRQLIDA